MLNRKQFFIFLILLLIPWVNVIYSLYAENSFLSTFIPTNKCVELAKLKYSEKNFYVKNVKPEIDKVQDKKNLAKKEFKKENFKNLNGFEEKKLIKSKKPLKKLLIVGDSLGEGLYIAYYKNIKKEKKCLKVKFFVKHSTTTRNWIRDRKFLKELSSKKYDTVIVVLGANEFAIDKVSLYYNINKFLIRLREINPDIQIFWVVPPVPNKNLRKYVEECLGTDYTIALEDFVKEIPLSKDKIHPDIKKGGYTKLWHIVLNKLMEYRDINCQK